MKKVAYRILKLLLFFAILIPVYCYLTYAYEHAAAQNHINAWNRQRVADFYALRPQSLDMLFIGSSHSYCTFAPALIDPALGIQSFQFGMPQENADSSWFTLREALKTQRPSTVVMELYWDMLSQDFDIKQADTLFQAFNNDSFRKTYIKEIFPWNEKLKYHIPIIRYQLDYLTYENTLLTKYLSNRTGWTAEAETQVGQEYYGYRGFMHCDYKIPQSDYGPKNQFYGFDGATWSFSAVQKKYLEKIVELCAADHLRLIFVTAPIAPVSMGMIKNYGAVHSQLAGFAAQHKTPYLDYNTVNQTERLFTNDNFRDSAHLNYSGVEIADKYFEIWLNSLTQ